MSAVWLLARKDLRTLVRSRWVLVLFVLYPLAIAGLLGLVLTDPPTPKIALVNEDRTGDEVTIGDDSFGIDTYREQAEANGAQIVELDRDEALRALDDGQVVGVLLIPNGAIAKLRTQLAPTTLKLYTGNSEVGRQTAQRVRGIIYRVNLQISEALIEANAEYLKILVTGGEVEVEGREYDLYGLEPVREDLEEIREDLDEDSDEAETLEDVIEFAEDASIALELADNALEATAAPIRVERVREEGKSALLTATALSYALAVLIAFVSIVLVASSLAAERDERVMGRLVRAIVKPWQVLGSKLVFGMVFASVIGALLFALFAVLEPAAWERLPVLVLAMALSALACSAIGAFFATLAADARIATLVAIMVVLPFLPLTLLGGAGGPAQWVSQVFPLDPSQRLFNSLLFDNDPWKDAARYALHLGAIAAVFSALSLRLIRRLV